jgi:phage shock protein PspC (stress-responsive transcriptional regulator)
MKKTLTINISGIIFHIDEDAYDKLNAYLDTLKRHFNKTQGKDEIISDIEGRIAELLQDRMSDAKQVVTIDDVSEVIGLMGEPWEFETESEEEAEPSASAEGVKGPKRLYRDSDRKVVGGVAAGVAAYLNIDVLWVRLAFVLFTIIWLSGALVYIILWIAMPEARTTAEKLQMKGEKVNISNIEKSIKEEVDHLKDKINDLTNQAKKKVEKTSSETENVFEQLISIFVTILKVFLKIIVIIIGIALLLTGIGLAIGFLFALFGWGGPVILDNNEAIIMPLKDFFYLLPVSGGGMAILKLGLVLFVGIPLLMLMYNAFRMIFGIERIKYVGITAFNVWIIGLIITLFFAFRVAREYRHHNGVTQELSIQQPVGDTLILSIDEDSWRQLEYNSYDYIHTDDIHLVVTEEGEFYEQIELFLDNSRSDEFVLKKYTHARGRTPKKARENAENIEWNFYQDSNTLLLDPFYLIGSRGEWQAQHIELELEIPVGKYIYIDESVLHILEWGRYSPRRLVGKTWLMTEDGLVRPGEEGLISPTLYFEAEKKSTHPVRPMMVHMMNLVW